MEINETRNNALYATNVIGVTGIEGRKQSGTPCFLEKDAHGDVLYAVNNGTTIANYTYNVWGDERSVDDNTWEKENPVRYNGQYLDTETGMYYLRARYYDPSINRFISEDPHWNVDNMIYGDSKEQNKLIIQSKSDNEKAIFIPDSSAVIQTSNLYPYCMNNPVTYYDILGTAVHIIGGAIAAQCGFRIGYNTALVWDDNGNVGIIDTVSAGGGTFGCGINGMYGKIDADNINVLQGASCEIGGGISVSVLAVGFDLTITLGEKKYHGKIFNVGASGEIPFDGHIQMSYTNVTDSQLGKTIRVIGGPILGNIINTIFNID